MSLPAKRAPTPASWKPGQSGNPKGRPRTGLALAETIRARVDPNELTDIALSIARGEPILRALNEQDKANGVGEYVWPSHEHRLRALDFLRDSGFIKPPVQLEVDRRETQAPDYSRLSDEELDTLVKLHERALGVITIEPNPGAGDE